MSLFSWFKGRKSKEASVTAPAAKVAPKRAARPPVFEGLEGREFFSASPSFAGVSVNGSMSPSKLIPILKKLHVKEVRLWFGMKTWTNRGGDASIKQAQQYHAAGFTVMMNVEAPQVPSYAQAASFMKYLVSRKDALKAVDLWEIGNEPNRPPFWHGSASQYVNTIEKAAWDVLHKAGEKIVGAGATYDLGYAQQLVNAGYLKYCDYANFHPYDHSGAQVVARMAAVKKVFKNKPLVFSEWNVRSQSKSSNWIGQLNIVAAKASKIANYSFYFCLVKTNTMAGPAGLLTSSGGSNAGYASMFQKWFE